MNRVDFLTIKEYWLLMVGPCESSLLKAGKLRLELRSPNCKSPKIQAIIYLAHLRTAIAVDSDILNEALVFF